MYSYSILKPNDYWANLLLGACYTWNGNVQLGQQIIENVILLDSSIPNGYSLLAQNYQLQGKKKELLQIVQRMSEKTFSSSETQEKINEAMACIKSVFGEDSSDYRALIIKFNKETK